MSNRKRGFPAGHGANRKSAVKTLMDCRGSGQIGNVDRRLVALATLCDRHERQDVAELLDVTVSTISCLLNGTYTGNEERLLKRLSLCLPSGVLEGETSASDLVETTWGRGNPFFVPEAVRLLAAECDRTSRQAVAERYGVEVWVVGVSLENETARLLEKITAAHNARATPPPRSSEHRDKVVAAHGGTETTVPPWLLALADAADRLGQKETGRMIEHSPGTVSEVIAGKYKGDLIRYEADVRGRILKEQVICPGGLGDIRTDVCMGIQRPLRPITDPLDRMIATRHCPKCPNFSRGPRK